MKACDECVYRRAYEDCIKFATRAKDLANSRTELKILQTVVQGGSDEAHHKKESRKIFSITSSQRVDNSERVLHEMEELLVSIEDKIEELNATRGEVVPDMQAAMAEAISGKSSKTSGSGKRRGSLGNDSNSDTPGSGSGGASDDGSGSSGPPQRPSRMSGKLSGKLSTGNLLASAAAGIASISMDGSHSRHTSIAVARQKSRELDWESEVKHHLISAEQQAEEEKAAYNIKNLCVVM